MSKVAIQGNASGTGTFTIAAPNSNTDRTLTLPDEAGTVLTSAGAGTEFLAPNGDGSSLTGITQGITHYSRWSRSNGYTLLSQGINEFTTNWSSYGPNFGAAMSESGGVFTFPTTGMWLVTLFLGGYANAGAVGAIRGDIDLSTNGGSSFSAKAYAQHGTASAHWYSSSTQYLVNASDTSLFKVRMRVYDQSGGAEAYFSDGLFTSLHFIRIGEAA